ncbi:D-alanyl-D-alanine carboxypeptidase/D-alanyl-D-alanine-endopeptidase [Trebonia kvetii]|uniref:D-alanyl-D-alanine carboxypeptidase/D-alanyl-D-alanine-endopeptidase n=1 Tax=Trebonia kvetii TaxID=2480626 RepID=A0A6P2BS68_9ACTN|nr:D-alanyl-D-alanine carboxypeptidase/D-alanyl-D-alanine-endopeptidase [Trebonia kvetii]TVZ00123.1 D-alanyl-D-alanine carboxypeptidase/D-alanyl-D-alanine-endopeptidase [Trebonia kvetii]
MFVRRTRITALATLALVNVFTLAAGLVVAHMLPPRLARLHVPLTAAAPVIKATSVLAPAGTAGGQAQAAGMPTAKGLLDMLSAALPAADTGGNVGIEVADAASGRVLYSANATATATPASTTKVLTAVAALAALGPDARFSTVVRQVGGSIVLAGGGDPTLAVHGYPSSDYPQPATLARLATSTAKALKSQGHRSVRLGYDTSLYTGSDMAAGWTYGLVSTGNVTPVVSLEVDQGRLTTGGEPQDKDDPVNFRPRTTYPAGMAASAFAAQLEKNGITVTGAPERATAPASARVLARVSSPPLVQIAEQMLLESNNVIAENLARHVAIALGMPATFTGAAAAEVRELRRLGITTPVSLVDGSGLSPQDGIAPQTLVRAIAVAARTPRLSGAITGLPVAGFNGTLSKGGSVFGGIGGIARGSARGVVRAKTGNLATVATLAGLAYDKDGRLLFFAIMAPQVPTALQLQQAADDIDAAAAGLATCGCR